jgi:polyphosphate kinase 2 (PPK2 family)
VAPRLKDVDLDKRLSRADYEDRLSKLQKRLSQIQQAYLTQGRSAVLVFEGWDAAGKGGCIRRMSAAMDPRGFKVWPIAAPGEHYQDRHWLLRFWERTPPTGGLAVFDRSWYGRVLVERVEGLTPKARWKQGYREINAFEEMLLDSDRRIVKLFFHISPDEQLKRFEARLRHPLKRWKLSYEDFRNRERWNEYAHAIDEMFARTSTAAAPWTLIAAEQKRYARISALQTIADALARDVDLSPPKLEGRVVTAANAHFDMPRDLIASLAGRTE